MKLFDRATGYVVGEIITNRSMTIDEALDNLHCGVSEDGIIVDLDSGKKLNAGYDDLEMDYSRN